MAEEKLIMEFSEDDLRGELFAFADIPAKWHEGDFISELNRSDILEALDESASYVDIDSFEDGGPGMSDNYYKVYAYDKATFRQKLTEKLMTLLLKQSGKS